jgi:glucose-6-phosphate 1-dehydrogenase
MENSIYPEAAGLVIFGAGGDLTRRKLAPALYDLFLDHYLPERFAIIGIDLQPLNDERFRERMREGVGQFSRRGKVDVLQAIRSIEPDEVHLFAARGQYDAGWISGTWVPAYRSEPGVAPNAATETFAAIKLFIDSWRWQDVPFYLRTGKRLPARVSEVVIQLRPTPRQMFPASAVGDWQPNRLAINIQPVEGILLRAPGAHIVTEFRYRHQHRAKPATHRLVRPRTLTVVCLFHDITEGTHRKQQHGDVRSACAC